MRNVAKRLAEALGPERVFFDEWYEHEILGTDCDLKLKRIYRDESDVIVPFFSQHYEKKWCLVEWSAIRSVLSDRRTEDAVLPVHMDGTRVEGWESVDLGIRRRGLAAARLADHIVSFYRRDKVADVRASGTLPRAEPNGCAPKFSRAADELETAYQRLEDATVRGEDTSKLRDRIRELKRSLRSGPSLAPGYILGNGKYRLVEILGVGAFATVWRAYDRASRSLVAIKVLHAQWSEDRTRLDRFVAGAKALRALRHPSIVAVLAEPATEHGYHYFVMEHLPAGDLTKLDKASLSIEQRLLLIVQLAEALQFAHESGMIHRDLKPENVVLDAHGNPKLTDFDLVRVMDDTFGTRTGALGSFLFSAPEALANAATADARSDVYSLAMTTLYLLADEPLSMQVVRDPGAAIDRINCSDRIKDAIAQGLRWDVSQRTPSVRDFCRLLTAAHLALELPRRGWIVDPLATHEQKTEATLRFSSRLSPTERFVIDGVIQTVKGVDQGCEVVFFHQEASGSTVRISAKNLSDIERVVAAIGTASLEHGASQSSWALIKHNANGLFDPRSSIEQAVHSIRQSLIDVSCLLPDGSTFALERPLGFIQVAADAVANDEVGT